MYSVFVYIYLCMYSCIFELINDDDDDDDDDDDEKVLISNSNTTSLFTID